MSVSVEMLFDAPQREIASVLSSLYSQCTSASLVAGFMTVEGIAAFRDAFASDPDKLRALVVGAATWRALDAFDVLLSQGVPPDRLRVHLGRSRQTGAGAAHRFYRYHPMLHSKVYFFELPEGESAAVIGSHNLTGFALHGLNGEAAALIRGDSSENVFADVRQHIAAAVADSNEYDANERDAYAWWSAQFMEGLAAKFSDAPREGQAHKTIIILAEAERGMPSQDDVIYFELPAALGKLQSMSAEVHVYLFDHLPATPRAALAQLDSAKKALWCRTIGIEDDQGGRELRTDWFVESHRAPVLKRAPRPFRPAPGPGMQQVRVRARDLFGEFEYIFDTTPKAFEPVFDREDAISLPPDRADELAALKLVPREDLPWFRVVGFRRKAEGEDTPYKAAVRELSPESGAFILMSMRRRER